MSETRHSDSSTRELEKARELLSSSAIRALAEDVWQQWRPFLDWPLLLAFVAVMTLLFAPISPAVHTVPLLDSIAPATIRAERDVVAVNERATELRRQAAVDAVLPIYDYDPELYPALGDGIYRAVRAMARRAADAALPVAERREAFETDMATRVDAGTFSLIEPLEEPTDLAAALSYLLNIGLDRFVVADRSALKDLPGVQVRNLSFDSSYPLSTLESITDLAQLRRLMEAAADDVPYGSAGVVRTWILQSAKTLAAPNFLFNEAATGERREAARASVEPVYERMKAGEVIVREGDRVTAAIQERLRILNQVEEQRAGWIEWPAFALLMAGLLALGGFFFRDARQPLRLGRKACYQALTIVLATSLVCVAAFYAGRGLAEGFGLSPEWAAYLMPVALVTVLILLLVDSRTSLLAGVALSLLAAYRADGDMWLVTYYVIGVLVAGVVSRHCRRRSDLLRTGLAIGLSQAAAVPAILVLSGMPLDSQAFVPAAAGLASGAILAISVLGLMPIMEYAFNETTDMRLMELASADSPLLKELALHSPGTYFHSVVMGNLAEAAAHAIGANALQCRVMALYHDVGKMQRPSYFAENQHGANIHDRLPPELSARIIFAHIKDGIDVALKHRLGRPVIDAITQHQGTTLLKTFYVKAVEQARAEGRTVREMDFRYPGPKPRTKESGILMLADCVEAATRALSNPSPKEVQERIHQVIGERVADGQLDDCQLTMKDLAAVEAAFTRVITLGVYHSRVEYPPMPRGDSGADDVADTRDRRFHSLRSLADRSS